MHGGESEQDVTVVGMSRQRRGKHVQGFLRIPFRIERDAERVGVARVRGL